MAEDTRTDNEVDPAIDPKGAAKQRKETESSDGPEVVDDRRASRDAIEGAAPRAPGINTQTRVREQMHQDDVTKRQAAQSEKERTKAQKVTARFLKLSGYEEGDVIGVNENTRTFVTSNGGKYTIVAGGKSLRVLSGPDTPNMIAAEREEEEEAEDDDE